VNLRTARVLLGERNAGIEAVSEWETVRGEEADMLYPAPTASFSPLSHSLEPHTAIPHISRKRSWPVSMTFWKLIVLPGKIHARPQTVANHDVLRRTTHTGRRPA
jgi:hypothetical protein